MLEDNRTIRIARGEGRGTELTLGDFLAANVDGIDLGEALEIQSALSRDGFYEGGGGATGEWRIDVVVRPLCPRCANRGWVHDFQRADVPPFALSYREMQEQRAREFASPRIPCPLQCAGAARFVCEAA